METRRQNPPMTVADPGTRTGRLDLMRGLPVVIAFVIQSGLYVFNGIDDSMDLIDASWIFMFAVTVAMLVAAAFRCRKFPAMLWKSTLLYFAVGAMFVLEFEARFIPEAWHPAVAVTLVVASELALVYGCVATSSSAKCPSSVSDNAASGGRWRIGVMRAWPVFSALALQVAAFLFNQESGVLIPAIWISIVFLTAMCIAIMAVGGVERSAMMLNSLTGAPLTVIIGAPSLAAIFYVFVPQEWCLSFSIALFLISETVLVYGCLAGTPQGKNAGSAD